MMLWSLTSSSVGKFTPYVSDPSSSSCSSSCSSSSSSSFSNSVRQSIIENPASSLITDSYLNLKFGISLELGCWNLELLRTRPSSFSSSSSNSGGQSRIEDPASTPPPLQSSETETEY